MRPHARGRFCFRRKAARLYKNNSPQGELELVGKSAKKREKTRKKWQKMAKYCDKFKAIARGEKQNDPVLYVARLRCKMWSCEFCANKNRGMWRYHITDWIAHQPQDYSWLFWTVTAHQNARTPELSLLNLRGGLDKLFKRAKRIYGAFEYVRVFEKHKRGAIHAHILIRAQRTDVSAYKMTRWLKDNAAQCGMGHQACADILQPGLPAQFVAHYITKYMTKDAQDFGSFPRAVRRIQTSRGIGSPKQRYTDDTDWQVRAGIVARDAFNYSHIYDVSVREIVHHEYFIENDYYPPDES